MTPLEWSDLEHYLLNQADGLADDEDIGAAYIAMLLSPQLRTRWWVGLFEQSEAEGRLLDTAAKAIANEQPLPALTLAQRGRLVLRLRLAARLAWAMQQEPAIQPPTWFPIAPEQIPQQEFAAWLLVDGWKILAAILDESLTWASEGPMHAEPSFGPPPPDSCGTGNGKNHTES